MVPLALLLAVAPAAEPRGFALKPLPFPWSARPGYPPAPELALSADGRLVAVVDGDAIRVWSVAEPREVTRMHRPAAGGHTHLAFLPDGKTLVAVGSADTAVRWFDLATGKLVRERPQPPPLTHNGTFYPTVVRLAAAGDWHLGYGREAGDITAMVWDTATGDRLSVMKDHPLYLLQRVLPLGDRREFLDVTYSADEPVRVWDGATGKRVRGFGRGRVGRSGSWPGLEGVSPDGRLVGVSVTGPNGQGHQTEVWQTDTGRRVATVPGEVHTAAFGADSRTLVVAADKGVRVYDLARDAFDPDAVLQTPGRCAVATRDGKTLAVVVWPHDGQPAALQVGPFPALPDPLPAAGDLVGDALTDALAMLGSAGEARGRWAVRAFAARPEQALAVLGANLAPDSAARRATVADLIRTLDADDPDVRDKALAELLPLAHRFEPLLAAAHAAAKPGEVRHRLATALAHVREEPAPADLLTDLRAVEVLETIGTAEAKTPLVKLAAGADGSRLTAAARAAVARVRSPGGRP